jgi:hypothetical protein
LLQVIIAKNARMEVGVRGTHFFSVIATWREVVNFVMNAWISQNVPNVGG